MTTVHQAILGFVAALMVSPVFAQTSAPLTIFGDSVPINASVDDPNAVTLGAKWFANVPGTVSGIRFYRGHSNSAGYRVRLYSAAGTLLASARLLTDSCAVPCWEQANFAAPISVAANTTYVAAYYTSNGDYADDTYALANGAGSAPLYAQANGGTAGGNGVYAEAMEAQAPIRPK